MTYEQALAYVAGLEPRGWRLGLDRMRAFLEKAHLTESLGPTEPAFFHVAGTNGKGSVTAFLQSMLVEHGFRTGAFFSPYVVDPRERVQFGREMIPRDDFAEIVDRLRPVAESFTNSEYGGISEFEFKTAVGFEFWHVRDAEWVALEVGLGGRLDATNVVQSRCTVIVSIGLDHTQILGETYAKIAYEKAGIIQAGVPLMLGETPEEARAVIVGIATELGAPVWEVGREIRYELSDGRVLVTTPFGETTVRPSLAGSIQVHNVALAVAAMQSAVPNVDSAALQRGASTAYIPGRFQELTIRGRRVLVDGAHNADAAKVLRRMILEKDPGPYSAVVGMTVGHEPEVFLREIRDVVESVHVAPISFHRAQSPEAIASEARKLGMKAEVHGSLEQAFEGAMSDGRDVLVTGSFYLVGELLRDIGVVS